MNNKPPHLERNQTDQSLRTERKNTDRMLEERREQIDEKADEVLEHSRQRADAVLDATRGNVDGRLDASAAGASARAAVASQRAREDEALRIERLAADETLGRERKEQARTLAALLPLEREKTDRHLLTERARADAAVAHRDDFLGIVSHDLRNLLGAIAANAMLLRQQPVDSGAGRKTAEAAQRIERYVARMNRLIGDLVDVASIDAGKLAVETRRVDVGDVIAEAVEAFTHAAQDKAISLEYDASDGSLPAEADQERILQVLANLITNAIKFTASGGAITVGAEHTGREVHVWVSDSGEGIREDMLDAVFERFWQVGNNDRRGLGLGLYISKCIVEAHGGRIWAESTLGAGSTFHFITPAGAIGA